MSNQRNITKAAQTQLRLQPGDIAAGVLIDGAYLPLVMPANQPRTTFAKGINPWTNTPQKLALKEMGYVVAS